MLSDTDKPGSTHCPQAAEKMNWTWAAMANTNLAGMKDIGLTLLLVVMCVYNLSKLTIIQKLWMKSRCLLPDWLNGHIIDKRIDVMTAELRMEMRELSEQIVEFQKWSQVVAFDHTDKEKSRFCQQNYAKLLTGRPDFICPMGFGNEISECNWLQYMQKYVYNPRPRILDTSELENTKRVY